MMALRRHYERPLVSIRVTRHCEERSDEAIQLALVKLDCFASLAMTTLGE
jgi:hypothetical protein